MTYEDAVKLRSKNEFRIGSINDKGFYIGEIIIVPSNEDNRNKFFRQYLYNRNAELSILPFSNDDVLVWAIDTKHLQQNNVLFYDNIEW